MLQVPLLILYELIIIRGRERKGWIGVGVFPLVQCHRLVPSPKAVYYMTHPFNSTDLAPAPLSQLRSECLWQVLSAGKPWRNTPLNMEIGALFS